MKHRKPIELPQPTNRSQGKKYERKPSKEEFEKELSDFKRRVGTTFNRKGGFTGKVLLEPDFILEANKLLESFRFLPEYPSQMRHQYVPLLERLNAFEERISEKIAELQKEAEKQAIHYYLQENMSYTDFVKARKIVESYWNFLSEYKRLIKEYDNLLLQSAVSPNDFLIFARKRNSLIKQLKSFQT